VNPDTRRRSMAVGAQVRGDGTCFRVWAPAARSCVVVLEPGGGAFEMRRIDTGLYEVTLPGVGAGALYRLRLDGGEPLPDPASRFQPLGVNGPSMVVDPTRFAWSDGGWRGVAMADLVFYELHVGTFSPSGTFAGVTERLGYLHDLGVTAVELMPVSDFPGRWNWGYDPAALFAPSRAYGAPDDLRTLVDEAHRLGVAVYLDVVYNHLGPAGASLPVVNPQFFSHRHHTGWGKAVNLDGAGAGAVRRFFIDNALHWLEEYHLDGLRLDATHALQDDSPRHFLAELSDAVAHVSGPRRRLIAEDHRNLNTLLRPREEEGHGIDGVWVDDFHHGVRCTTAGDRDSYYADFTPGAEELARTINQGWLYTGQRSRHSGEPRGTDPRGLHPSSFVYCIQNHDQIGNRAFGDRLTDSITPAQYRAVSSLLLFLPQTPLLFMGQEWGAATPFLFFTDHDAELGARVREGRRKEFAAFANFGREVPDPQSPETFARSHLRWDEPLRSPHAGHQRLYRELLAIRRRLRGAAHARPLGPRTLAVTRSHHTLIVALDAGVRVSHQEGDWVWHSAAPAFERDARAPFREGGSIVFPEAAALILETDA
jgi:maltooligosyltrehalose trehalohydrolase